MKRTASISLAVVAVLAVGAAAGQTASAAKLMLSEGGVSLARGEAFEIYGKNNVVVNTSLGNIECIEGMRTGLRVSVISNSQFADVLEVKEPFGALAGGEDCRAGEVFVRADVFLESPARIRLRANGEAGLRATEGPIRLRIQTEFGEGHSSMECTFKAERLAGSNNATSNGEPLTVKFSHILFLDKFAVNSKACPKHAELFVFFDSALNGETERLVEEQI
jgi:hypothetical protein